MADEILQNSQDGDIQSEPTDHAASKGSNGVKTVGRMAKKGAEKAADRLAKDGKAGTQYKSDDFTFEQKKKPIKTDLNDAEKKRKAHLEKKQREGYLSGAEQKELDVLKQTEKKAKAGAKEAQRIKTLKAKRNFAEYNAKGFEFGSDTYFNPDPVKKGRKIKNLATERLSRQANAFADDIVQGDEDNWGGEAAVKTKQNVKGTYDFLSGTTKNIGDKVKSGLRKKAGSEGKKQFKSDTEYLYQDFLGKSAKKGGEAAKKSAEKAAKEAQKRKVRRDYAKALAQSGKAAADTSKAAMWATGTAGTTTAAATTTGAATTTTAASAGAAVGTGGTSLIIELVLVAIAVVIILLVIAILIFVLLTAFTGTVATTSVLSATSYHTERSDLDDTEEYITSLELALEDKINSIEDDYPDYDEYEYDLVEIGHDAFDLSNYLNAKYPSGYTFADIKAELDTLFDGMYELTLESRTETRTRYPECHCDHCHDECGEHCDCEDPEDYEVEILSVKLTKKDLTAIADSNLTEDEKLLYEAFEDTGGLIQVFGSPLHTDWLHSIGRNYGSSRNPSSGDIENHKGIDVNVAAGTEVYAATRGTVTAVGNNSTWGNYISIKKSSGEVIKFAHLQSVSVSVGDTVTDKSVIGLTGTTGTECNGLPQLHIETLDADGNYMNPVFALESYSGSSATSSSPGYGNSSVPTTNRVEMGLPTEYASGDVEDLISFSEQFIGTPYVWGGSSPGGFDCSGFVSYCVRESGYYPSMQRTDAQGIYETYCTPVSASEAQAGDLIFFKGTNSNSPNTITHVGIYCGNGVMLHAGSPINYCNINTSYWTQHLYGYGHIGL